MIFWLILDSVMCPVNKLSMLLIKNKNAWLCWYSLMISCDSTMTILLFINYFCTCRIFSPENPRRVQISNYLRYGLFSQNMESYLTKLPISNKILLIYGSQTQLTPLVPVIINFSLIPPITVSLKITFQSHLRKLLPLNINMVDSDVIIISENIYMLRSSHILILNSWRILYIVTSLEIIPPNLLDSSVETDTSTQTCITPSCNLVGLTLLEQTSCSELMEMVILRIR